MNVEEHQESGNADDNTLMQLRQMNSLLYYKPSQSSLFSSRQQKVQPFLNQNAAPGSTAQIIINSDEFVYGPTSCVKVTFTLTIATGAGAGFPASPVGSIWGQNGSVLNIFNSVRLYHRSGQVLEEVPQYAGQLMNIKRWYLYNQNERLQLDAMLNNNYTIQLPAIAANVAATVFTITAVIPLSLMFGVFDNHNEVIPPQLLSGAKIEYVLNQNANIIGGGAFLAATTNTATISNINMSLLLDTVQVFDVVKRQLAEEMVGSGGTGLQYTYETTFQTSISVQFSSVPTASTTFSFDINQANTIVKNIYAVFMISSSLTTMGVSKNAFINCVDTWQGRSGSHYYPNQQMNLKPATLVLTNLNSDIMAGSFYPDSQQAYENTMLCFDSQAKQFSSYLNTNTVTIGHFNSLKLDPVDGSIGDGLYNVGNMAVYGILLDRSCSNPEMYGGIASNNSRLINLSGSFTGNVNVFAGAPTGIMLAFTTSARVACLIGDSCIVDR